MASVDPLMRAASLGELEKIDQALSAAPDLARARDDNGRTALHHAAWGGYREIVDRLVSTGAEVDARDRLGRTPLTHMVAWCTRPDVVELLLRCGADINAKDDAANSALYLASSCIRRDGHCWGDHAGLTTFLLARGADMDLHTAAILGRELDAVTLIARNPTSVNTPDRIEALDRMGWNSVDRATPLHRAADCGQVALAKLLLEHGASRVEEDARGRTPLYLAAHEASPRRRQPAPEIAEMLASDIETDIFADAVLGRADVIAGLLDRDPSLVEATDNGDNTPLHLSLWAGRFDAADLLLSRGAPVDRPNLRGEMPIDLMPSISEGETRDRIVERLLAAGSRCDLFAGIGIGRLDLMEASLRDDPGALGRTNRRGRTPLRLVAEALSYGDESRREAFDLLIESGAEVDIWTASAIGDVERVRCLIAADSGLLNTFDNTFTPIHCAAKAGQLAVIELLLDQGAAIDPVANDLMTPTILALWSGQKEAARLLVSRGANVNALDNWSKEPWIASALASG